MSIAWVLNEGLVLLLTIDKETFFFLKIKTYNTKDLFMIELIIMLAELFAVT